jgi:hypothetical protein
VVVNQVIARLVEDGGGVSLSNGQTNSVGETLTQRTSGDLDTRGVVSLGVTGSDAINLSEALQVVHGDIVTEQVEESVLEHATVAVGKNETIPVQPVGILGVEVHELVEEDVGHRGHAHRGTGVTGIGLEGGIDRKNTDRVDSQLIQFGVTHDC